MRFFCGLLETQDLPLDGENMTNLILLHTTFWSWNQDMWPQKSLVKVTLGTQYTWCLEKPTAGWCTSWIFFCPKGSIIQKVHQIKSCGHKRKGKKRENNEREQGKTKILPKRKHPKEWWCSFTIPLCFHQIRPCLVQRRKLGEKIFKFQRWIPRRREWA